MKTIRFLLVAVFSTMAVAVQAQPASADEILSKAIAEAARQDKKVMLIFHASWCGWCHKMDTSLNDIAVKKFFDDRFVITHVTVLESKGKEYLENPGGKALMEKYNGKNNGIPYWVIFDSKGTMLADSRAMVREPDGTERAYNVGCPASRNEVNYFISVLIKTTNLSADQLDIISKRFRENEN
ncbi:MAG TPA: thioredoxin family protein [Ferruginibacter sp.]|nr:thioredoxin family protein [Ferruginibacter sp.]